MEERRGGRHTGTIVVGLKQSKATANGKDVGISLENHFEGLGVTKEEARVDCLDV